MMFVKAFVLVSAVACLISAENKSLKERLFKCKLMPLKKHHSIFDSLIPSIIPSLPIDSAVPNEYSIPATDATLVPFPNAVPAAPQLEVQYPSQQEVQYPSQQEVQNPSQQEVKNPPQQEVQNPSLQGVQNPSLQGVQNPSLQGVQPEGQSPAQQLQGAQNPSQEQPLYPPQHEGQRPTQQQVTQSTPSQNEGLYPPQHNGQYYPAQNEGQYYPAQNEGQYYPAQNEGQYYAAQNQGLYYPPPPNYQGLANYNVPYNLPFYGQNVLRSVKSLDAQTNPSQNQYLYIRKPYPYNYVPRVYPAPYYYNYVPRTAQAILGVSAKST